KQNILRLVKGKIEKKENRLLLYTNEKEEKVKLKLSKVFGIAYFAKAYKAKKNIEDIKRIAKKNLKGESFLVKAKRSDKKFELNSLEIERELGSYLEKELKIKVDFENPKAIVYVEILKDFALVYFEKIKGLGGLPVSTSGRALVLFSGGIDSPVASLLMMKRGCKVDLLHFHVFENPEEIQKTKIFELSKIISSFQGKTKLYLANCPMLSCGNRRIKYTLQIFRRAMLRVAEEIAKKYSYDLIVTGESLGQVASQTINNIKVIEEARKTKIPLVRPLIAYDKQEIVELAKKFGTFEVSTKKYIDCCTNLAKHPKLYPSISEIKKEERALKINEKIKQILKNLEVIEIE
ncbi:MAG: tRNA uracil 4-sulfurtransferase ThiI, partial [Candidatus Micrarchaeia archaeon]